MSNKKFTKDDLKVGYVVKTRNDNLYIVMELNDGRLIFLGGVKGGWICVKPGTSGYLNAYSDDLLYTDSDDKKYDVMEVYGFAGYSFYSLNVDTQSRPLLWKREEPKEMTHEEIEKALGYPVKIIEK